MCDNILLAKSTVYLINRVMGNYFGDSVYLTKIHRKQMETRGCWPGNLKGVLKQFLEK
jgi:hypothetical protein